MYYTSYNVEMNEMGYANFRVYFNNFLQAMAREGGNKGFIGERTVRERKKTELKMFDVLFGTMNDLLTMVFLLILPIFLKVPCQNTSRFGLILKKRFWASFIFL